jgi:hypothetical protein
VVISFQAANQVRACPSSSASRPPLPSPPRRRPSWPRYVNQSDAHPAPLRPQLASLCVLAAVCSDPAGPPPLHFCTRARAHPPGGQRGSGSWIGCRIADGGSHAIRTRVARTDPCGRGVVAWSCAVVPPRLMWHAFAAMARASTEGARARLLRQYLRR